MQNEIHNFYQQLYSRVPATGNFFDFVNFSLKTVTPEENEKLVKPITMQEIAQFIKTLSPHKAPGITGLTSAFYITFWDKIKNLVLNATNSILLETKRLPNRQNIGIITLIPKQDKDQRHIGLSLIHI